MNSAISTNTHKFIPTNTHTKLIQTIYSTDAHDSKGGVWICLLQRILYQKRRLNGHFSKGGVWICLLQRDYFDMKNQNRISLRITITQTLKN